MRKDQLVRAIARAMASKAAAARHHRSSAEHKSASARAKSQPAKAGVAKAASRKEVGKKPQEKRMVVKSAALRNGAKHPGAKIKTAMRPQAARPSKGSPAASVKNGALAKGNHSVSGIRSAKDEARRAALSRKSIELLTPPAPTHPFQPLPVGAGKRGEVIKDLSVRLKTISKSAEGEKNGASGDARSKSKRSNTRAAEPRDRLVLMVRDSFWLQAEWEISRRNVERARAAMAEHWHTARPIIRLYEVDDGGANTCEQVLRDIEIHGGVNTWHIDVYNPPGSFRVAVGYLGTNGKFHALARSNAVTTPHPGSGDAIDENWSEIAENYEKIYSLSGGYADEGDSGDLQELFEERLRRPMGAPLVGRFGEGAQSILNKDRNFAFEVDAEMIIYGATKANARVTIGGEPVKLRRDGTFTVRQSLPDRRQVLPVVASSSDGIEQRTIVLAIERNTKVMEPLIRDGNE
jgi:hypothetical protein